ncbi:transposase [Oharaeibacter diazotrophicus]|nr:transposase [Oharaeibacter diazotrophicus]
MRKSRFSEEQIIGILKEHQAGIGVANLCRKHGISDATFHTWHRSTPGGSVRGQAAEGTRGGERQAEEALAESMLDVSTFREALGLEACERHGFA